MASGTVDRVSAYTLSLILTLHLTITLRLKLNITIGVKVFMRRGVVMLKVDKQQQHCEHTLVGTVSHTDVTEREVKL